MAAKTCEVEVWVLVDENGDYVAAADQNDLGTMYDDNIGADASTARRVVKVTLTVPLPVAVELAGVVPEDPEDVPVLNVR